MSYKKKVESLAKKLGATVDASGGEDNVEAPVGYVWKETGDIHELVNSPWGDETMTDMYKFAYQRMRIGIEPCHAKDCEYCESLRKERG